MLSRVRYNLWGCEKHLPGIMLPLLAVHSQLCVGIAGICFGPRRDSECLGMWASSKVTSLFVFGFTNPGLSWFGSWELEKHTSKRTSLSWWEAGLMLCYCNCQIHQSLQAVFKTSSTFILCSGRIASLFWQCLQKSLWDLFILDYVSGHPCSCLSLKVSSSVVIQVVLFVVVVWFPSFFFPKRLSHPTFFFFF